jgi:hypothetical protein
MNTVSLTPFLPVSNFVSEPRPKSLLLYLIVLPLLGIHLLGCGGKGSTTPPPAPPVTPTVTAPAISVQPANQTASLGLTATFSVVATGSSLQYQWSKNGSSIAGATGSSYTTPATTSADAAATFTVTVSNSVSSVTSSPASLTLTARAPASGDLRFQQVDAPSTVNGYGGIPAPTGTPTFGWYNNSIGSPLFLSPTTCTVSSGKYTCSWGFQYYLLPSSLTNLGLSIGYGGGNLANFQADLQSSTWPTGGTPVLSPTSVVTSLDIESAAGLFAASWIQTTQGGGFDASQQTVALADLPAAATQEGAHSRVITALSYNAGSVSYFSYGWQSDTSTIYETSVATSPFATLPTAASTLATQGYILTAITPSGNGDSYILVGTRVQGDTVARPFMTAPSGAQATAMMQQGYAVVSVLVDSTGAATYLGER